MSKPLSSSSAEPERPLPGEDAENLVGRGLRRNCADFCLTIGARRESPLRDVFLGPKGIYPGTRWLIYLAIGVLYCFEMEGWLKYRSIRI